MPTPNVRFKCPHCGEALEAPGDMLGQLMDCPTCGETVEVQKAPATLPPPPPAPHLPPRPLPKLKMPLPAVAKKAVRLKEYKVLTQRDERFGGAFSPEKLEAVLNAYAAQGWHVVSVATLPVPDAAGGARNEPIAVLEQDK